MKSKFELIKELTELTVDLDNQGGLYKDQADRLVEIIKTLKDMGAPIEEIEFVPVLQ